MIRTQEDFRVNFINGDRWVNINTTFKGILHRFSFHLNKVIISLEVMEIK
jgi:hypothetical protein